MFRIMKWDGLALAFTTQLMLLGAAYCGNKMVIFYWYWETDLEKQFISGIPLSTYGVLNMLGFNGIIAMALLCHFRAGMADPGEIPKDIVVPDYVDIVKLANCEKGTCCMRWKP